MDYNIIFEKNAKKNKKQPLKTFADRDIILTYEDIHEYSLRVAHWLLAQGIQKGDSFAIWMGNVPEFVLLAAASLRIGTVLVPISVYETLQSVEDICLECNCKILFYDSHNKYIHTQIFENTAALRDRKGVSFDIGEDTEAIRLSFLPTSQNCSRIRCELDVDDVILISYTSGSTGKRKGIQKSLRSYFGKNGFSKLYRYLLSGINRIYPLRVYSLCPWYHNTGLSLLLIALSGGPYQEITNERYLPTQAVTDLKKYTPNLWLGTATMLYRCCLTANDPTMQLPTGILSTGEALPYHVIEKLKEYHGISLLYSGYGTTEAGNIAQICYRFRNLSLGIRMLMFCIQKCGLIHKIYHVDDLQNTYNGTILGDINKNVDLILYDDTNNQVLPDGESGEICVHTATAMRGYTDKDEAEIYLDLDNTPYLRTGDLGYKHGNMLFLTGRKKNLIIRSGSNILPIEIERVAQSYPDVEAAIACGIPSKEYGEDICLCLQADKAAFDLEKLQQGLKSQLPKYMYPQHFLFWEEFPTNASGKTDIKELRREAAARCANEKTELQHKKGSFS